MNRFRTIIECLYPKDTMAYHAHVIIRSNTREIYAGEAKNIPEEILRQNWWIVSIVPDYDSRFTAKYRTTPDYNLPRIITVA